MQPIRKFRNATRAILDFRRALAERTPLIDGRETRRIARLLRYDPDQASRLVQEVPFDPRETYPSRAVQWARSQAAD